MRGSQAVFRLGTFSYLCFSSILLSVYTLAEVRHTRYNFLGNFMLAQHSAGILFKYGRCS